MDGVLSLGLGVQLPDRARRGFGRIGGPDDLGVQQFEGNILTPVVQQFAVDLPGVVLLFSLITFGLIFGTLGVILAAPLAVVCYVLVKRLYVVEALHTATPIPGEKKGKEAS